MRLPFSVEQFFAIIRQYNEAVWPAQVLVLLMGLAAIALLLWKRSWSSVAIAGILALLWTWMGVAYHLAFFTSINPLAYVFGAMSLVGAAVFVWLGMLRRELDFVPRRDGRGLMGMVLVVFALLIYPVWSSIAGHAYPNLPTFGLPCPTTIFTIGMLAMAVGSKVRIALVVPILWSFVGGQAAFLLDVPPDSGLLVAGLIALGLALRSGRSPSRAPQV
ncbi:DUF6064 family protein [Hydrogenophaga sp.]|uniref:DUF6064 family protein n=1 Tax=Hydrogenophaga sp. TaxID=1904254 RepID=UPI0026031CE1|nr:DUF6064 family protein [Hydrogenophaga sp.]MDM7950848.1 DUF6064 family protein [Hydrogenophaga sp.]